MKQVQHTLRVSGNGRGFYNITRDVQALVGNSGIATGLATLFVRHTSCSLMVQENADPDVLHDMEQFMQRLVEDGDPAFRHSAEGPDDMPAHIRMALTQVSLTIPVTDGRLALGVWQGIYLYEHRLSPMNRNILLHLQGA